MLHRSRIRVIETSNLNSGYDYAFNDNIIMYNVSMKMILWYAEQRYVDPTFMYLRVINFDNSQR